jgi:hypothetical protein
MGWLTELIDWSIGAAARAGQEPPMPTAIEPGGVMRLIRAARLARSAGVRSAAQACSADQQVWAGAAPFAPACLRAAQRRFDSRGLVR